MTLIGFCGDNCSECPRYIATLGNDTEKLREAALMWKRVGWRDTVLSTDEIKCGGCRTVEWCRYSDIRECAVEKDLDNCGECREYSCDKISRVFKQTDAYAGQCRKVFSKEDFAVLSRTFFTKNNNLDKINQDITKGVL